MNALPQQTQTQDPTWGAPQNVPAKGWSARKTVAAVGVAAVIAAGGGAAIYAASGSSGNAATGPGGMGGPGMSAMGGGPGAGGGQAGPMSALHGEFVVADSNGGYTTEVTQTGTVTAVSATSITTKSADNFTRTYTIGAGGNATTVAVGDTATIRGTVSGDTATATTISEGTGQMGGPPPGR